MSSEPRPDPSSPARGHTIPELRPDAAGSGAGSGLILTGERTLPGIPDERYWFQRHVVAYRHAAATVHALAADRDRVTVLDAGCGEGYGLAMLAAAGATRVVGIDLEWGVVDHARATYGIDPRIEVRAADLAALPDVDLEVDLVVSFQVIEHLHDVAAYLRELVRVTRAGGQVQIATPNRLTFSPDRAAPVNPFHVREFTAGDLHDELTAAGLVVDQVLGVHHGPRLQTLADRLGRPVNDALATPPGEWDPALRTAVHATRVEDFVLSPDDLATSLDLLATAHVPMPAAPPGSCGTDRGSPEIGPR